MAAALSGLAEEAWNEVKPEGDAEFNQAAGEFRNNLLTRAEHVQRTGIAQNPFEIAVKERLDKQAAAQPATVQDRTDDESLKDLKGLAVADIQLPTPEGATLTTPTLPVTSGTSIDTQTEANLRPKIEGDISAENSTARDSAALGDNRPEAQGVPLDPSVEMSHQLNMIPQHARLGDAPAAMNANAGLTPATTHESTPVKAEPLTASRAGASVDDNANGIPDELELEPTPEMQAAADANTSSKKSAAKGSSKKSK